MLKGCVFRVYNGLIDVICYCILAISCFIRFDSKCIMNKHLLAFRCDQLHDTLAQLSCLDVILCELSVNCIFMCGL